MKRLIVYIDGFNLYYGLKSKGWRRYYWLNVQSLVRRLARGDQELILTKYFTSRVSSTTRDPHKQERQDAFLRALQTLNDFKIYYGHYLQKTQKCFSCGAVWDKPEEKMTDVNIAVELMTDAFHDNFDVALILSADSDLVGPISAVRGLFPEKRIVVGFPPNRVSQRLRFVANAWVQIYRRDLSKSQFPDEVIRSDGSIVRNPWHPA